ncbi:hypothetical protein [Streptomyces sp. NPDC059916]
MKNDQTQQEPPHDLITAVRRGLRQFQYRHEVLDGWLTGTGLAPAPP